MNWLGTSVAGGNVTGAGAYPTSAVPGVATVGERSPLLTQARIARSAPLKAVGLLWTQDFDTTFFIFQNLGKPLTWSRSVVQLHIG